MFLWNNVLIWQRSELYKVKVACHTKHCIVITKLISSYSLQCVQCVKNSMLCYAFTSRMLCERGPNLRILATLIKYVEHNITRHWCYSLSFSQQKDGQCWTPSPLISKKISWQRPCPSSNRDFCNTFFIKVIFKLVLSIRQHWNWWTAFITFASGDRKLLFSKWAIYTENNSTFNFYFLKE